MEDWSKDLAELAPNNTYGDIKLVIDKFKTNRTKWNEKQGIQNIFRGLELLKLEKGEHLDTEKGMKYRVYGAGMPCERRIYENDREF